MNITISSVLNAIAINVDGEIKYYGAGELHPSSPDNTENTVYIHSTTAIFEFDKAPILIDVANDTINVNGVTSFADADALVTALATIFFSINDQGTVWHKFGFNVDVDTGSAEILASFGGAFDPLTQVLNTDGVITITYNNTLDGSTATGARSLIFYIVREEGGVLKPFIEVHNLGSSGSEATTFTARGINRVAVLSNGGLGRNGGTIDFSIGGTVQGQIPVGADGRGTGTTEQVLFHTSQNTRFDLKGIEINCLRLSGGGSPVVTIYLRSWSRVTGTMYRIFSRRLDTAIKNDLSLNFGDAPLQIGGNEVIYAEALTDLSNTFVNGRIYGIERKV